jgi:hypothetical protein
MDQYPVVRTIPAPLSQTVQTAMYVSGVLCLLGGALAGLAWFSAGERAGFAASFSTVLQLMMGVTVLRTPERMQQQRKKRLKDYQASAPPGAPPPVEKPRPPDAVFLSTIFGILSLFSAGAVAVLFGPAAVVCGMVALSQGHLKGLIGIGLGVVSLIVWGLVFVYFFQG